jgi:5-(carboxyamino)imidazole ribonucleotide mutase
MLAISDETIAQRLADYKIGLKEKIVKANKELADVHDEYKTN